MSELAQWLAYSLPNPAVQGSILAVPKQFSDEKLVNAAEVNQRPCSEECGQWLEKVDITHPVLAIIKLVLQKSW